jgi:hypothetical protein
MIERTGPTPSAGAAFETLSCPVMTDAGERGAV